MNTKKNRCRCCGHYMAEKYKGWLDANGVFRSTKCFKSNNDDGICFSCNFWMEHMQNDKNPEDKSLVPFICNHQHYMADTNKEHRYPRGFGGAKTKITFNDGRVMECDNVWFQGDIPKIFWKRMPDTAKIEWLH